MRGENVNPFVIHAVAIDIPEVLRVEAAARRDARNRDFPRDTPNENLPRRIVPTFIVNGHLHVVRQARHSVHALKERSRIKPEIRGIKWIGAVQSLN